MGHSQVPYFAVEAADGSVLQVTLVSWEDKKKALGDLEAAGKILPHAIVLDHPTFPKTPSQRWRIQNGHIIDDVTVPDPPHPRKLLLDQLAQATTLSELKTVLQRMIE